MPVYECTIKKQIKIENEWRDSRLQYSGFFAPNLNEAIKKAVEEEAAKNTEYGNSRTRYKLITESIIPVQFGRE